MERQAGTVSLFTEESATLAGLVGAHADYGVATGASQFRDLIPNTGLHLRDGGSDGRWFQTADLALIGVDIRSLLLFKFYRLGWSVTHKIKIRRYLNQFLKNKRVSIFFDSYFLNQIAYSYF